MKTLCVTYGGGHAAMIAPIAKRLSQLGHEAIILGLTTAEAYLKNQGLNSIGFRHLLEPGDDEALRWGSLLAKNLDQSSVILPEETRAYLGLSYQDLIYRLGPDEAARQYAEKGRQAFLPISILHRAIDRFKPDIVLATNSPRAEQAAILAARQLGLPSICINDLFEHHTLSLGQPGYADKVCVLTDTVKSYLVSQGRSPHEVEVTGNPAFDRLVEPSIIDAGKLLRKTRKWDDGKCTFLWASQAEPKNSPYAPGKIGDPELPRKIESALRKFSQARDDVRLVVRYHPSENVSFVPEEHIEFSPTSENLGALLHAVDAVVVINSTVGMEAALIGKPVFSVDASIFSTDYSYAEMGISTGCSSPEEIPTLLNQWLIDKNPPKIQHPLAGNAAEKIVAIMESLLHSRQVRPL